MTMILKKRLVFENKPSLFQLKNQAANLVHSISTHLVQLTLFVAASFNRDYGPTINILMSFVTSFVQRTLSTVKPHGYPYYYLYTI